MARIRTLKPEFWHDEKLAPLPAIDRLVFLGLISQADDAGRLVDNVRLIDGLLFPETDESSRESLETLSRLGRILRYTSTSGQRLIQVVGWDRHQKVQNAAKYTLPAPPPECVVPEQIQESYGDSHETLTRLSRSDPLSPIPDLLPATVTDASSTNSAANGAADPFEFEPEDLQPAAATTAANGCNRDGIETIHQHFMPVLRELRYQADDTDGSILKALERKRVPWDELENAVRGLAVMRKAGELVRPLGIPPDGQLSLRVLYTPTPGKFEAQPWWNRAVQAYWKDLELGSRGLQRIAI